VIFGRIIDGRDTVVSTQDIAREKALTGAPAGTVISAEFQTGGRGRQGKAWFAPHGANVCMTVIGPPVVQAEAWQVALLAGVSVVEGIALCLPDLEPPPRLRFPNDVTIGGRKVSGVLVEVVPHPKPGYVTPLIGIGVNVNIPTETFPEELRDRATSLQRETGEAMRNKGILQGLILRRLGLNWVAFTRGPLGEAILPRWRELADPDARRLFVLDGTPTLCRILDLALGGTVTLEAEDGRTHSLHAAQVIFGDD